MKRNPVAWVAILVSTAALVSSSGVLRRVPAAPNVSPESQKTVPGVRVGRGFRAAVGGSDQYPEESGEATEPPGLPVPGPWRPQSESEQPEGSKGPGGDAQALLRSRRSAGT